VINQTYQSWELIIVDDCSSDDSKNIVRHYVENDNRIILIELEKNVGPAEARNIALRMANGKYIAFLDSDDLWAPQKLDRQIAFMEKNNFAFSISNYDRITENGEYINTYKVPEKLTYKQFLRNTIIGTLTVVINVEKTGRFEMPKIRSSHDMALWCIIMRRGFNVYGLQEILGHYREVSTSNSATKWKAAIDVWKVYRKYEKINFLLAIYYFIGYAVNAIKKRIIRN
jgi:teichuronic acid biosynthesis glycosyltransferase TuaG